MSKQPYAQEYAIHFTIYDHDQPFAYYAQQLFSGKELYAGTYNQQVFKPPIQQCPVDYKSAKKSPIRVEFEVSYDIQVEKSKSPLKLEVNKKKEEPKEEEASRDNFSIVLNRVTGLEYEGNVTVRMALMVESTFVRSADDKPCVLTSEVFTCSAGTIEFDKDVYEFDVTITNLRKEFGNSLDEIFVLVYIMNPSNTPVGWMIMRPLEKSGKVNAGPWVRNMLDKPVQKPPFQFKKMREGREIVQYEIK